MHKKLLLGLIGTIIAGHAFAETTTQTIPTQSYVDTNFQTKIPAGSFGANNSVVTYGANAGEAQERLILQPAGIITEVFLNALIAGAALNDNDNAFVKRYKSTLGVTDEQYDNALLPAKYISASFSKKQDNIRGTTGSVPVFNGYSTVGGSTFTERAIYDGSTTYDSTTDADKLITAGAVDNKQNKMTCMRWLDTPEHPDHTDENCLLWQLNN